MTKNKTRRRIRRTKAIARLVRRAIRHSTSTWQIAVTLTPVAA